MIEISRTQKIKTDDIKIGDQIKIPLKGLGEFTTTAHKIADDGVLFIFDDVICERAMNKENINYRGYSGYENSDLKDWIDNDLYYMFPENLRNRITNLSIPTYGMIFGHSYNKVVNGYFKDDENEQLELMKNRKNRIAWYKDDPKGYWLQNFIRYEHSDDEFACVNLYGYNEFCLASSPTYGVRPSFVLVDFNKIENRPDFIKFIEVINSSMINEYDRILRKRLEEWLNEQ